jgi:beta-lactamase class A
MRICPFLLLFVFVFVSLPAQKRLESARESLLALINLSGAQDVAVAVDRGSSGERLLINERVVFHAASTMKLPVMMKIFELAKKGKLSLEGPVEIRNTFASIVDGSPYSLRKEDDGEQSLYDRAGANATIRELVEKMIVRSSNLATNLLIEKAGADSVTQLVRSLGGPDMTVRRGVEDGKAFRAGINNTTTAYDLMMMLDAIAETRFLDRRYCDQMIDILSRQEFNQGIPAGLPAGTRVAHKTGSITAIRHDAGIVFPAGKKPYVLVVLTRGVKDEKRADELIAGITRIIQSALGN